MKVSASQGEVVVREGMRPMTRRIKEAAPIGRRDHEGGIARGRMKRSIRQRVFRRRNKQVSTTQVGSRRELARPSNDFYYPGAVEFGTRKMTKRPFIRPTWRRNRSRLLGDTSRSMKRAIRSNARRR